LWGLPKDKELYNFDYNENKRIRNPLCFEEYFLWVIMVFKNQIGENQRLGERIMVFLMRGGWSLTLF
jgi:hypothetical protein